MDSENDKENAFFDDIIEYDCEVNKRSRKITSVQCEKLKCFMDVNPDFTKGKTSQNQLHSWEKLCDELNAIGPPHHSSLVWRRVWTDFKASQKRKPKRTKNSRKLKAKTSVEANRKRKSYNSDTTVTSFTANGRDRSQTSEGKQIFSFIVI